MAREAARKVSDHFDGADDPAGLKLSEIIPHHYDGDIVITTRDADTRAFGHLFFIEELPQEMR